MMMNLALTSCHVTVAQLPKFEHYVRPQVEYYITVIRLFGIKTATIIVILLSLRAKMHRV